MQSLRAKPIPKNYKITAFAGLLLASTALSAEGNGKLSPECVRYARAKIDYTLQEHGFRGDPFLKYKEMVDAQSALVKKEGRNSDQKCIERATAKSTIGQPAKKEQAHKPQGKYRNFWKDTLKLIASILVVMGVIRSFKSDY